MTHSRSRFQARRGFTLIEVMIAIALLSLIVAAVYSSWTAILGSSRSGMKAAASAQRSRMAMHAIEQALLTVQMFSGDNLGYYTFLGQGDGESSFLSFTSRLPENYLGGGYFGDQSVRRVTFTLEPGTNSLNTLVLTQQPLLSDTNAAYPIVLSKDVNLFVAEFWEPQRGEWLAEWVNSNQVPRMVRITLGMGRIPNSRDPAELIQRTVAMPTMPVTREMQMPATGGGLRIPGGSGGGGPSDGRLGK